MYLRNYLLLLIIAFFGTLLRFYLGNNFIISLIGSFVFGYVTGRSLSKFTNKLLIHGFCSCFTSFSGFIYFLYQLINQQDFIETFIYLNIYLIFNLFMMNLGFSVSRKFT